MADTNRIALKAFQYFRDVCMIEATKVATTIMAEDPLTNKGRKQYLNKRSRLAHQVIDEPANVQLVEKIVNYVASNGAGAAFDSFPVTGGVEADAPADAAVSNTLTGGWSDLSGVFFDEIA